MRISCINLSLKGFQFDLIEELKGGNRYVTEMYSIFVSQGQTNENNVFLCYSYANIIIVVNGVHSLTLR